MHQASAVAQVYFRLFALKLFAFGLRKVNTAHVHSDVNSQFFGLWLLMLFEINKWAKKLKGYYIEKK